MAKLQVYRFTRSGLGDAVNRLPPGNIHLLNKLHRLQLALYTWGWDHYDVLTTEFTATERLVLASMDIRPLGKIAPPIEEPAS